MLRAAIAAILGLSLLFTGCQKENEPKGGGKADGGTAASAFSGLTLDEAKTRAQAEKKLVMIDFYADWCGPCKMLDAQTFPDAKVAEWLKANTVAIKVNIDENRALAEQFKIQSIPQLVFLDGQGKEVKRVEGFVPPEAFLSETKGLR